MGGQEYGVGASVHGLLEDDLFANNNPRSRLQRKTFRLRKDLVKLRRVVLPMRDMVTTVFETNLSPVSIPSAAS